MCPARILPASLLAAALALPLASAAHANIVITVDKTTQQMAVDVDGAQRYVWPVSTGRHGYDTPNGTFRPNRMDADHLSQEWDNAPMPHSIFFDLKGHAIHGFFDVKHLGLAVSHGCVRLSPAHASTLFDLVKSEGMADTTVIVSGRTPPGGAPLVAQRRTPEETASNGPMEIAPAYGQQPAPYYGQPAYAPPAYNQQGYGQPAYGQSYAGRTYYQQPYGGQSPYAQSPYAPSTYQQPQYYRPSPY